MAEITNYIQQIQAGETTYDIAVKHGIQFKYGAAGAVETSNYWDGTDNAFVVTIPSVTDIIQSPVIFAGTVDSTGAVTYVSGITATPTKGYLVYITQNCTFGGQVCEAGDMAVHDGTTWRVIQGENQVQLIGTPANNVITAALGKSATNVITVDGTTLALNVDLADLRSNMTVDKNAQAELGVTNGKVTVSSINLSLSQGANSSVTVAEAKSFDLPTALESGAVTINESVLTAGDFTFTSGAFPTISKNASAVTISASTGISIGKANANDGTTGDYVTSVTAIKGVSFAVGTSTTNDLAYVGGITAAEGTSFVSGIHAYTAADDGKTADLVIPGAITADSANNTFVTGLEDANAAGDTALVSSITVGTVSVDANGNSFLAGLSKGGNAVVTSVSLGTAVKDTTVGWFYDGLTTGTDVVTDVTVGAVSLVADNNGGSPAIISASVSEHVLSFNTANFMTPVAISQVNSTITKGGFTKAAVSLSGFGSESDVFTKAGITQAATTIAYKSITTGAVNLTVGASTSYFFDKTAEHTYSADMVYKSIQVTDADVLKNTPVLENSGITATIPADTVAVALTGGTLPSLSISAATGTLTGSVPTALASTPYEFSAVSASAATLTIPGAYSLVSVSEGGVAVGKAGEYSLTGGKVTLAADTFVTDVKVDGTAVGKTPAVTPEP